MSSFITSGIKFASEIKFSEFRNALKAVGEKGYKTFKEVVEATNAGDTVTIFKNAVVKDEGLAKQLLERSSSWLMRKWEYVKFFWNRFWSSGADVVANAASKATKVSDKAVSHGSSGTKVSAELADFKGAATKFAEGKASPSIGMTPSARLKKLSTADIERKKALESEISTIYSKLNPKELKQLQSLETEIKLDPELESSVRTLFAKQMDEKGAFKGSLAGLNDTEKAKVLEALPNFKALSREAQVVLKRSMTMLGDPKNLTLEQHRSALANYTQLSAEARLSAKDLAKYKNFVQKSALTDEEFKKSEGLYAEINQLVKNAPTTYQFTQPTNPPFTFTKS